MVDFCERKDSDLIVRVRLTPNARDNSVGGTLADESAVQWLRASVRAAPEKGKANRAIIELLAKQLGIAKTRITLSSGPTGRAKKLVIANISQDELENLQALAG